MPILISPALFCLSLLYGQWRFKPDDVLGILRVIRLSIIRYFFHAISAFDSSSVAMSSSTASWRGCNSRYCNHQQVCFFLRSLSLKKCFFRLCIMNPLCPVPFNISFQEPLIQHFQAGPTSRTPLLLFSLFRHMPSLIHRSRSAWCLFHMKVCCKWCSLWS